MSQTKPHFDHHKRELKLTQKRFSMSLLLLLVAVSVGVGLQYSGSQAATKVKVSGRVYNSTNGLSLVNVKMYVCSKDASALRPVTNGSGVYSFTIPSGGAYCVRYSSGAPANVQKPLARKYRPYNAGTATYEYQRANMNCYTVIGVTSGCSVYSSRWDLATDSNLDIAFSSVPVVVAPPPPAPPKPQPVVTPAPAVPPVATPRPVTITPRPTSGGSGSSGTGSTGTAPVATAPTGSGTGSGSGSGSTGDTTPPTTPTNVQALVSGTNAVITLSWDQSTDDKGIAGYQVERSLDQKQWAIVKSDITQAQYVDDSLAYGVHYYYRVHAVDTAGNSSGFGLADATTGEFGANSSDTDSVSYTSDDGLLSIVVPAGTLATEAKCSIETVPAPSSLSKNKPIAGPYTLVCKDSTGAVLAEYKNPTQWTFSVKDQLKGLGTPNISTIDSSGKIAVEKSAKYDSKAGTISFNAAAPISAMVLASKAAVIPWNFIIVVVALLLIIGVVYVFIVRRNQKSDYDEHLRSKYYNI